MKKVCYFLLYPILIGTCVHAVLTLVLPAASSQHCQEEPLHSLQMAAQVSAFPYVEQNENLPTSSVTSESVIQCLNLKAHSVRQRTFVPQVASIVHGCNIPV
jgi:hypothetical protein